MRMNNNKQNNIIMHFKGQEEFVSRMLDLDNLAFLRRNVIFTPFLNANELDVIQHLPLSCKVIFEGGYEEAEWKRAAFVCDERTITFPICILKACYDGKYHSLNHRDILGSFMNLGMERSIIGDILVQDDTIYLIAEKEMCEYIKMQFTMAKHCRINFEEVDEVPLKKANIEYREMMISSFRLDVVVAAITYLSRDKAKNLIRSGSVKVNQVVLEDYDYLCNNNSTISIRRYGRFVLSDQKRRTKKERFVVSIGKYV